MNIQRPRRRRSTNRDDVSVPTQDPASNPKPNALSRIDVLAMMLHPSDLADTLSDIIDADERRRQLKIATKSSVKERLEDAKITDTRLIEAVREYGARHPDASTRQVASALLAEFPPARRKGRDPEREADLNALAQRIRRAVSREHNPT